MTHPTEQQLQSWLDAEADLAAETSDIAAHVADCARCRARIEGVEQLGAELRLWAEDAAPVPASDFADGIMAALARSASGTDLVPARSAPVAATSAVSNTARTPAPVVDLASRRRRAWLLGAPVAVAAAAALIFAVGRPQPGPNGTGAGAGSATVATRAAATEGADSAGSEVEAVESDDDRASVSVLEVEGERAGETYAVVWIEQPEDDVPAAADELAPTEQEPAPSVVQ